MKEESDSVAISTAAQHICDWYQMIIMYPDQIISLDNLFELGDEMIVDLEISAEILTRELGKIQPVM